MTCKTEEEKRLFWELYDELKGLHSPDDNYGKATAEIIPRRTLEDWLK
jgi:hypothetical protein